MVSCTVLLSLPPLSALCCTQNLFLCMWTKSNLSAWRPTVAVFYTAGLVVLKFPRGIYFVMDYYYLLPFAGVHHYVILETMRRRTLHSEVYVTWYLSIRRAWYRTSYSSVMPLPLGLTLGMILKRCSTRYDSSLEWLSISWETNWNNTTNYAMIYYIIHWIKNQAFRPLYIAWFESFWIRCSSVLYMDKYALKKVLTLSA